MRQEVLMKKIYSYLFHNKVIILSFYICQIT